MLLFILFILLVVYYVRSLVLSYIYNIGCNFTNTIFAYLPFNDTTNATDSTSFKKSEAAAIRRDCDRLGVLSDNSEYELYFKGCGI